MLMCKAVAPNALAGRVLEGCLPPQGVFILLQGVWGTPPLPQEGFGLWIDQVDLGLNGTKVLRTTSIKQYAEIRSV